MGSIDRHLGGSAVSITTLHYQVRDLWRSPRGAVLRIEALALVAIALSFLVVCFGSCRRWSNHWIVQKGFLAAQVLSLSLGTYSIGLMQSAHVKSEMYPIWAVSMVTLFGCIDPVTTYIGLEYKGPLSKMIFQLCLYYGYVMLMTISTMYSGTVKVAIYVLSAVTFIKSFHRSLAVVQQRTTRMNITNIYFNPESDYLAIGGERMRRQKIHMRTRMEDICDPGFTKPNTNGMTISEVCVGYSWSQLLQQRFLGLTNSAQMDTKWEKFKSLRVNVGPTIKQTLKIVGVELAFLYDVYFTSNEFLHFYQAKTASFWALISFIGICFLGAVVAVNPDPDGAAMASRQSTTPAGAGITLLILVSLALLQLTQLIRCWTSNWAIVSFVYEQAKGYSTRWSWMMELREFLVTRMNWFDKYLWQDKLGQYSIVDAANQGWFQRLVVMPCYLGWIGKFGVTNYIVIVFRELLGSHTSTEAGFKLHEDDDVKESITEFLGQLWSRSLGVESWSFFFVEHLPYNTRAPASNAYAFTCRVMVWHIVTCYCEQVEVQEQADGNGSSRGNNSDKNRRVAIALSKYLAYLVVSAPELLPGSPVETRRAFEDAERSTKKTLEGWTKKDLEGRERMEAVARYFFSQDSSKLEGSTVFDGSAFAMGVLLWKTLLDETPPTSTAGATANHWELLARLWVKTLLYAAPYGDVQSHMQHLSQGGELITHLWALLYHLGIDQWEIEELKAGAAEETTTTRVQVEEDAVSGGLEIEEIN